MSTARPRVICHMMTSIDGRIMTQKWPLSPTARKQYELVHASFEPDAWMCGRVTMEPFAKHVRSDQEVRHEHTARASRDDFRAPGDYDSFAVAIDAHGRLAWESNDIDGDHVVAVLSERVSDDYLAFLRTRGVSYILAGARDVDLSVALSKIREKFGVKTLMLEGGGKINGGMLRAGLIDEVSVLVVPVVDGRMGTAALFDVEDSDATPAALTLRTTERLEGDVLWLRYDVG